MALGAEAGDVILMILRQISGKVLCGVVVGPCRSLLLAQAVSSLLFGAAATDLATIATVAALIGGVALAASSVPALRAARLEPVRAIRQGD